LVAKVAVVAVEVVVAVPLTHFVLLKHTHSFVCSCKNCTFFSPFQILMARFERGRKRESHPVFQSQSKPKTSTHPRFFVAKERPPRVDPHTLHGHEVCGVMGCSTTDDGKKFARIFLQLCCGIKIMLQSWGVVWLRGLTETYIFFAAPVQPERHFFLLFLGPHLR